MRKILNTLLHCHRFSLNINPRVFGVAFYKAAAWRYFITHKHTKYLTTKKTSPWNRTLGRHRAKTKNPEHDPKLFCPK